MQVSGKKVLITGGGSGIGLCLAKEFLKAGGKVIICGRDVEKLEKAKAEVSGVEIARCDITVLSEIEALKKKCDEEFGGIDVLINNAGIYQECNVLEPDASLDSQLKGIDINVSGAVRVVHVFLPGLLKKADAAVVNVSSGLAFVPLARAPMYSAAKAAMHAWTRAIRKQLEKTSVKVFELMPPVTDTEMVRDFALPDKMSPEKLAIEFMKSFGKDRYESTPGQASGLRRMSRFAPGFIFKMINQ